jgi:hypothetical protein
MPLQTNAYGLDLGQLWHVYWSKRGVITFRSDATKLFLRDLAHSIVEDIEVPDWVSNEVSENPPETVILEGSPNIPSQAPQQIFVQGQGGPGMIMPTTNAVLALVLGILGLVMCGICTAVPGLILAQGALATTNQYPGHPDQGVAKAAQIVSWIAIGITLLVIMLYGSAIAVAISLGA